MQKGFLYFFTEADADIFCIQESKMQEGQLELDLPGYHQYWNYAVKKGYSGTAVFTKNVVKAAPILVDKAHLTDGKARAIVANSGNANACAPQG